MGWGLGGQPRCHTCFADEEAEVWGGPRESHLVHLGCTLLGPRVCTLCPSSGPLLTGSLGEDADFGENHTVWWPVGACLSLGVGCGPGGGALSVGTRVRCWVPAASARGALTCHLASGPACGLRAPYLAAHGARVLFVGPGAYEWRLYHSSW